MAKAAKKPETTASVVMLRKACGGLEAGAPLARIELPKGVSLNFLVDAYRSGIAREVSEEEFGEAEKARAAEEKAADAG